MNDPRSKFSRTTVLVAGDLMLDEYLFGNVSRISPEAPVPVLDVKKRRYVPGGAANVAANVQSLGAQAKLAGVCGEDLAGATLRQALSDAGLSTDLVVALKDRVTTSKTRVVAGQQQIVRYDSETRDPLDAATEALFEANVERAGASAEAFVLSDYGKGLLSPSLCASVLRTAARRKATVIVDPKGQDFSKYKGCSVITPNLKEAGQAVGLTIESDRDLYEAGNRLLALLPGTSVLVTRGADGMTLFRSSCDPLTIATVAQEVFDVVGAGDTVVAALSVAVAAGFPLETATRLANIAAGIAVGKHGTVSVTWSELLSRKDAEQLLEDCR